MNQEWPSQTLIQIFEDIIRDSYDEDTTEFAKNLLHRLNEDGFLSR